MSLSRVCVQDTKIASLERNIRDLEDEIQMLKANSLLNTEDREEEIKQMEVYKNHSKFMKTKVEAMCMQVQKQDCSLISVFSAEMMILICSQTLLIYCCRFGEENKFLAFYDGNFCTRHFVLFICTIEINN